MTSKATQSWWVHLSMECFTDFHHIRRTTWPRRRLSSLLTSTLTRGRLNVRKHFLLTIINHTHLIVCVCCPSADDKIRSMPSKTWRKRFVALFKNKGTLRQPKQKEVGTPDRTSSAKKRQADPTSSTLQAIEDGGCWVTRPKQMAWGSQRQRLHTQLASLPRPTRKMYWCHHFIISKNRVFWFESFQRCPLDPWL